MMITSNPETQILSAMKALEAGANSPSGLTGAEATALLPEGVTIRHGQQAIKRLIAENRLEWATSEQLIGGAVLRIRVPQTVNL